MGLPILTAEDFKGVGQTSISNNQYDRSELESYISSFEKELLCELLGCSMADDLISDLDGDNYPTTLKYQKIWDEFCIDDDISIGCVYSFPEFYAFHPYYYGHGCKNIQWKSKGIREYLKYQIYFLYTRDQATKNTVTGNVQNQNNVSTPVSNYKANMVRIYNDSIDWHWAIQWYICKNPDSYDYSNFNGKKGEPIGLF